MKARVFALLALLSMFLARPASAQTCEGTCVASDDLKVLLQAAKEKKCLLETPPQLTADPLTVVVDREGRIYGSGSDPHPFKVHLTWCTYDVTAEGQTKIFAAQRVEPTYGFRFRPKATLGILVTELVMGEQFGSTVDGGLLLEPFYVQWVNLNGYVGVRSAGAGLGFDLTKNFGVYLGYAVTWGGWRSNPFVSAYFSFW